MQPESETEQPKATTKRFEKSPRRTQNGAIAQLVEQWTENPCVPGSNPGGTTKTRTSFKTDVRVFFLGAGC